jgi:hypothetical protein
VSADVADRRRGRATRAPGGPAPGRTGRGRRGDRRCRCDGPRRARCRRAVVPRRPQARRDTDQRARRGRDGRAVRHRRRRDAGELLVRPPARMDGDRRRVPRRRSPAVRGGLPDRRQSGADVPRRSGSGSGDPLAPGHRRGEVPVPGLWREHPRPRVARGASATRPGVPGEGQWQRPLRARVLPRHGHAVHRAVGASLHDERPLVLVVARPHVPEPSVPARGAVGRPEERSRSVEAGHVHHEDDLGQPAERQGPLRVLLHRSTDPDVVGRSVLRHHALARPLLRGRAAGQARERRDDRPRLQCRATHRRSSRWWVLRPREAGQRAGHAREGTRQRFHPARIPGPRDRRLTLRARATPTTPSTTTRR